MTRTALAIAAAFAIAAGAQAGPISKPAYQAQQESVDAHADAAQARCKPQKGNDKDVCMEQARGARKVALAELDLQYKPSRANEEKLRIVRAEANYAVAREKCEPLDGNMREICRKDAKAMLASAKADAKLQQSAAGGVVTAPALQGGKVVDERQHELQYAAARERCDALQGAPREDCLLNARKRFGKL